MRKIRAARQNPYCRALFRRRKPADACIVAASERASGATGRCHFNDRVINPVTEGVDLSLRLGDVSEGFVARPLGTVRRVLLASPALLAKMGHPDTPDALTDYPFAAVSGVFASNRIQLVASEDQLINVPRQYSISVHALAECPLRLLAGHAIGVLQSPVCRKEIADGALIPS